MDCLQDIAATRNGLLPKNGDRFDNPPDLKIIVIRRTSDDRNNLNKSGSLKVYLHSPSPFLEDSGGIGTIVLVLVYY